jgi:ribulose-5-phosphate 4-epimerase/fuculose-1-phosphate aldolase
MTVEQEAALARGIVDEPALRRDLAACLRLVALEGWTDMIANHISVRIPGTDEFLLNPFGMLFEEVTASDLLRVNTNGEAVGGSDWPVNRAGFVIHSAVHMARPDVGCVIHIHTRDGVAVSCLEDGLLPINQTAMLAGAGRPIAYHDYEGPAFDLSERQRLVDDLGESHLMFLRNHGTLATGDTVAGAFSRIYRLEWACAAQVRALSMSLPICQPSAQSRDRTEALAGGGGNVTELLWAALLRKLDRIDPSYRN